MVEAILRRIRIGLIVTAVLSELLEEHGRVFRSDGWCHAGTAWKETSSMRAGEGILYACPKLPWWHVCRIEGALCLRLWHTAWLVRDALAGRASGKSKRGYADCAQVK